VNEKGTSSKNLFQKYMKLISQIERVIVILCKYYVCMFCAFLGIVYIHKHYRSVFMKSFGKKYLTLTKAAFI